MSTHVAIDHQPYSALAQQTQITWTAQLISDEHYRVERWGLGNTLQYNPTYIYGQLDQLPIKIPSIDF